MSALVFGVVRPEELDAEDRRLLDRMVAVQYSELDADVVISDAGVGRCHLWRLMDMDQESCRGLAITEAYLDEGHLLVRGVAGHGILKHTGFCVAEWTKFARALGLNRIMSLSIPTIGRFLQTHHGFNNAFWIMVKELDDGR